MPKLPGIAKIIYYDGLCHLCYREIEHFKKLPGSEKLEFRDITLKEFNAEAEGLDPYKVHQLMHVRLQDGSIAQAVDAFVSIWRVFPRYRWLANMAENPIIYYVLNIGYRIFARLRPILPKRKALCETSPYCKR